MNWICSYGTDNKNIIFSLFGATISGNEIVVCKILITVKELFKVTAKQFYSIIYFT